MRKISKTSSSSMSHNYGEVYESALETGYRDAKLKSAKNDLEASGYEAEVWNGQISINLPENLSVKRAKPIAGARSTSYWIIDSSGQTVKTLNIPTKAKVRFQRKKV